MAAIKEIVVNGYRYRAAADLQINRYALIAGTVGDELYPGLPLPKLISAQVSATFGAAADPTIDRRVTCDVRQPGVFCLSGDPALVFPKRDQKSYTVSLTLSAPGYLPLQVGPIVVDGNTVFPRLVPDVGLQAQAVIIAGRVTDLNGNALAGASVQVTEGVNPSGAPAGHAAVLHSPLQSSFPANTDVFTCTASTSGTTLTLTETAPQGAASLQLDQRSGLAVGQIIRLGPRDWGAYYRVAALPGPAALNLPGAVTLNAPLHRRMTAGTSVRKVSVSIQAQVAQLAQAALAGDCLVLLDTALGALPGQTLLQVGDAAGGELHLNGALAASDGYYRLEGIRRARTVVIEASRGPLSLPGPLTWEVDYATALNMVNLRLV